MIPYQDFAEAVGRNWFAVDPNLRQLVDRWVDDEDRDWAINKVDAMGKLIGETVAPNAEITDKNPPVLERWDRNGDETNVVTHAASALATKRALWRSGFLHLPFSMEATVRPRLLPRAVVAAYQYLLSQAETGMLCSVGMTTGVLYLIDKYGDDETKALFLPRLLDDDFDTGWDGSMYLTERAGGSDVGATEAVARKVDGRWRVDGFKWFCSNVDGRAAVTLARPEGAPAGVKGLALFAVPRILPGGEPNGMHIRRIKDKLGTRAVPTGEIDFVDARAYLLAGPEQNALDGRGINRMMEFVNESRLAVAAMGAGISRRAFLEAAIYASQRRAFGQRIDNYGMVREQLIDLLVESEAAAAMLFETNAHFDAKGGPLDERDGLGRILVPLTKMRCARRGIESACLALEVVGGNGYIENWPLARQLRDAQCHTVWEGTENILALDVLRAMHKTQGHQGVLARIDAAVEGAQAPLLAPVRDLLAARRGLLAESFAWVAGAGLELATARARRLANFTADLLQSAALLDEASETLAAEGDARKAVVVAWHADRHLDPPPGWGVTRDDPTALALFEPLVGYGPIAPEKAALHPRLGDV